jgi:hypothetical protein
MSEFKQFAIVELFGHQMIAGEVTEQVIGGQGFVRVDVPAIEGQDGFTKFYGAGAIYAITPVDEETMMSAVQGLKKRPVEVWKLNLPQLSSGRSGPDWGDIDDEEVLHDDLE